MKGSYLLLIKLEKDSIISIGKQGNKQLNKGYYIYVGSALNRLEQRIQRHLRKQKKMHWHIDYLLRHAKITNIFYKENTVREECNIAKTLEKTLSSIPGFGCSDCRCKSHLFYGSQKRIMSAIKESEMTLHRM